MRIAFSSQSLIPSLALVALAASASSSAHAHIKLTNPPSWIEEGERGDPQKQGPCGAAPGGSGVVQTNIVTAYRPGETILVTWQETIGHPGHFRISLAPDRAMFSDPVVTTTDGNGTSGTSISAAIMSPVAGPVLFDGIFPRASVPSAAAEPFVQAVTLPTTEGTYTLQVEQFMADHAPGYFYYHCADIRITDDVGSVAAGGGGGSSAGGQAGSASLGTGGTGGSTASGGSAALPSSDGDDEDDDSGCAIGVRPALSHPSSAAALALLGLAAVLRRRSH
ncbi:MAG: hypothetical protein RL685_2807 [Pseudomonadota bacterium]|jgi:hypothetical protein